MARPGVVAGLVRVGYCVYMGQGQAVMDVTSDRQDGILWLQVSGRINILNAPQFEDMVADVIEDGDRAVILDFENLVYISSAGLYAVLKIAKIAEKRDMAFALCSLSDAIHLVFERIGFDRIMAIHSNRAAALASLEG